MSKKRCKRQSQKEEDIDRIIFQGISNIFGSIVAYSSACEVEFDQCLCGIEKMQTTERK
jgi:hypothetical protein